MYKISLYLFLLKKYLFDWRQNSLIKKKKKRRKGNPAQTMAIGLKQQIRFAVKVTFRLEKKKKKKGKLLLIVKHLYCRERQRETNTPFTSFNLNLWLQFEVLVFTFLGSKQTPFISLSLPLNPIYLPVIRPIWTHRVQSLRFTSVTMTLDH